MDKLSELSHGAKVVLGAAIAFLIFSFFNWYTVDLGPLGEAGESMWHGVGVIAGLLAIVIIVWQAVRLANIEIEIGVGPAMVTAALAILLLIFTFIRFISKPGGDIASSVVDRTIWAWLGLILAIVIVAGAWLNMKATGESAQGMMDRFGSKEPAAPAPATPPPPAPPPAAPMPEQQAEPMSVEPEAAPTDDEHRHG
jgi:hypothetical protein